MQGEATFVVAELVYFECKLSMKYKLPIKLSVLLGPVAQSSVKSAGFKSDLKVY